MLYFSTSGYNYSKKRCEKIVDWFVSKYLSRYKIEIEVLHRGLLREGVYGWCTVQDCDWRPRSFLIELHNFLPVEDYTKTLLHELQHVLQHVRGDLKDKGQKRLWKGIDCSDLDYDDQPWEQEAHKLEEILYHKYLTDCQ
jgi:hypothetical protein